MKAHVVRAAQNDKLAWRLRRGFLSSVRPMSAPTTQTLHRHNGHSVIPVVTLRSTIHSFEASRALANDGPLRCAECDASSRHLSTTRTCFGSLFGRIISYC